MLVPSQREGPGRVPAALPVAEEADGMSVQRKGVVQPAGRNATIAQTVAAGGGIGVLADHVTAVPDVVADGESRGFRLTQSAGVVSVIWD